MTDEFLLGRDILFDHLKLKTKIGNQTMEELSVDYDLVSIDVIVDDLKTILDLNDENSIEGMRFILELCAGQSAKKEEIQKEIKNNHGVEIETKKYLDPSQFKHFMYCYNVACTTDKITLKLDLLVLLFIELFRSIDEDCGGGISVKEAQDAYNNVKKSNSDLLNQYSSLFEKIARYADNCGSSQDEEGKVEITEFDFLCVTMKPELLLVHYGNKYEEKYKEARKNNKNKDASGGLFEVDDCAKISDDLMQRGCDAVFENPKKLMEKIFVLYRNSRGKDNSQMDLNDFGYLYESVKDVMRGKSRFTHEMYVDLVFKIADVDKFGYLTHDQMKLTLNDSNMKKRSKEEKTENQQNQPVRFSDFKKMYHYKNMKEEKKEKK